MLTDSNQSATTAKNQDIKRISVASWKNSENKRKILKKNPEIETVTPITLSQTTKINHIN